MFRKRMEALLAATLPLVLTGCLSPFAQTADQRAQRVVDNIESDSPTTDLHPSVHRAAE